MSKVTYLITAKHYAEREKCATVLERIRKRHAAITRKSREPIQIQYDKIVPAPVLARIELGQVVADCECGGCEFVDPNEPIFFCFECFNRRLKGALRPVQFPDPATWAEIERLVLLRPVDDIRGRDDCDRAMGSMPLVFLEKDGGLHLPLTRSWNPNETLDDLHNEQDEAIEKYLLAQEGGA